VNLIAGILSIRLMQTTVTVNSVSRKNSYPNKYYTNPTYLKFPSTIDNETPLTLH